MASVKSVSRAHQTALAVCQFFVTGTTGFITPFLPLYVAAAGLSAEKYGLAAAIGMATCLLVQPLLGKLSDKIDARRPVMFGAALVAGLAYAAFRVAPSSNFVIWTLLIALGANGFQYLNAVMGVLVARLTARNRALGASNDGSAYVNCRVWGSVGFIVIALTAGLLVRGGNLAAVPSRPALNDVFLYGPLLFVVVAMLSFTVPDVKNVVPEKPPQPPNNEGSVGLTGPDSTSNTPPIIGGLGGHALDLQTRNRRRFLVAFLLYQIALYGASAYLSLYLAKLHAKPVMLTEMFAAGVISEVLVMSQIGRWTDAHGRRPAMLFSFLLLPIRLLLYVPATNPLWVLCVQALHGFNFGILGTIAVVFVNDTADSRNRGSAQAELAAAIGLGNSIGPLTCGWLVQHYGIPTMFAWMAGVAFIAAVLFCAYVEESHPAPLGDFTRRLPRALARSWFATNV